MRRLALAVFAFILLILAAFGAGLGIVFWQPGRLAAPLSAWLATEHVTARFAGPLGLTLAPRPKLSAADVTLETRGVSLHAATLTARIALRPLLRGRVVVVRLDLDGVRIAHGDPGALLPLLGGARTETAPPSATPPTPSSPASPPSPSAAAPPTPVPSAPARTLRLVLREIAVHEATLDVGGVPVEIERLEIGAPPRRAPRGPRQIELDAHVEPDALGGPNALGGPEAHDGSAPHDGPEARLAFSLSALASLDGEGVSLKSGRLSAPEGSLAFDLNLQRSPRPHLSGKIAIHRLDLDALRRALPRRPRPPVPAAAAPSSPPSVTASVSTSPPVPPRPALPFNALAAFDADLALSAAEIIESGASYRDLSAELHLANGALRLDPLHGMVPGGEVNGALTATASPPGWSLHLAAPALALAPVIEAFHWPAGATSGSTAVKLDLEAKGDGFDDWRQSLRGGIGIAAVDAAVGNAVLRQGLEKLLPAGSLPLFALKPEGASAVRCLALRLDAEGGVLRFTAARLETSRLQAAAAGTLSLAARTLDLTLVPAVSIAHDWVIVPLRLTGPLAKPVFQPDPDMSDADLLRKGDCAAALAAARFGQPGPLPAPPPAAESGHKKANLRGLLDSLIK